VPSGNVNSVVIEFAYRFGHYRQTSSGGHGKLSPQHIASARPSNVNSKTVNIHGFYVRGINDSYQIGRLPVGMPPGPMSALVREHSAAPSTLITGHIVNKLGRI